MLEVAKIKNASLAITCCILSIIASSILVRINIENVIPKESSTNYTVSVYDVQNNCIFNIPLEEYAWRVTAKEMPLSYHDEALKAQIILARTYALRKISMRNTHKNNAVVCTDCNHCTAFLTPSEDATLFSEDINSKKRLLLLVEETKNKIVTFDNQPILAVFHAISSGVTEKSSDIWQSQLPYLVNVDSIVDEKVAGYNSKKSFDENEIKEILNISTAPEFNIIARTDAGSVKTITINETQYTGAEVRRLFNLRSSNFSIFKENNTYTFIVKGYGHGVGMSQAGSNELAKSGLDCENIILKYYPGTEIKYFQECSNMTK